MNASVPALAGRPYRLTACSGQSADEAGASQLPGYFACPVITSRKGGSHVAYLRHPDGKIIDTMHAGRPPRPPTAPSWMLLYARL